MAGIQWRCVLTADQYVGLSKLNYRDKPSAQYRDSFAAKKYLDSHVRWKHVGNLNFKSKHVSAPSYTESEEISNNECTLVLDDLDVVDTRKHEVTNLTTGKEAATESHTQLNLRQRLLNV